MRLSASDTSDLKTSMISACVICQNQFFYCVSGTVVGPVPTNTKVPTKMSDEAV